MNLRQLLFVRAIKGGGSKPPVPPIPPVVDANPNLLNTTLYWSEEAVGIGGPEDYIELGKIYNHSVGEQDGDFLWFSQPFGAGTYTISADISGEGVSGVGFLCSEYFDGAINLSNSYYGYGNILEDGKLTFTVDEPFYAGLVFVTGTANQPGTIENIKLEEGDERTPYVQYVGENLFNIYGDKVFPNGDQWWHINVDSLAVDHVRNNDEDYVLYYQTYPAGEYAISATASGDGISAVRFLCAVPFEYGAGLESEYSEQYHAYYADIPPDDEYIAISVEQVFGIGFAFVTGVYDESAAIENIKMEEGRYPTYYEQYYKSYKNIIQMEYSLVTPNVNTGTDIPRAGYVSNYIKIKKETIYSLTAYNCAGQLITYLYDKTGHYLDAGNKPGGLPIYWHLPLMPDDAYIRVYCNNGQGIDPLIQLEEGGYSTSYRPFYEYSSNFNYTPYDETYSDNGITLTTNYDMSVSVSGNPTDDTVYPIVDDMMYRFPITANTYTLSGGIDENASIKLLVYANRYDTTAVLEIVCGPNNGAPVTFEMPICGWACAHLDIKEGANVDGKTFYPVLNKGDTAYSYLAPDYRFIDRQNISGGTDISGGESGGTR